MVIKYGKPLDKNYTKDPLQDGVKPGMIDTEDGNDPQAEDDEEGD
jgi:hypothetical protein